MSVGKCHATQLFKGFQYGESESCWLFRLVKWEILPVLPSWKLSGVGILANKALGPDGPRALLASIPTPLNFQLGNTDTV